MIDFLSSHVKQSGSPCAHVPPEQLTFQCYHVFVWVSDRQICDSRC